MGTLHRRTLLQLDKQTCHAMRKHPRERTCASGNLSWSPASGVKYTNLRNCNYRCTFPEVLAIVPSKTQARIGAGAFSLPTCTQKAITFREDLRR